MRKTANDRRRIRLLSVVAVLALACVIIATPGVATAIETITLRSGSAPIGSPDPNISVLAGVERVPLSPDPFTAEDFAAACSGPNATVAFLYPTDPWFQGLTCDSLAWWVGAGGGVAGRLPASTLYCQEFEIETCCIESASLEFCWGADDRLGDYYSEPNPYGVYLNGVAVTPSINGGDFQTESQVGPVDVTSLVQCGSNRMAVYGRDVLSVVSGVIYSATFEIVECGTPVGEFSWATIKALYR